MAEGTDGIYAAAVERLKSFGAKRTAKTDGSPEADEMRRNRAVNRKTASAGGVRSTTDLQFATGRPRDPLFYWKQNNIPYDLHQHEELKKVRAYSRLVYQSDPIVGSCIDIYCLAAETRVVTRHGTRRIDELAGAEHQVLTPTDNGPLSRWTTARFDSYGVQPLRKITMHRANGSKVVHASPGHRWITADGAEVITDDLTPGTKLKSIYPRNLANRTDISSFGAAAGVVYGDGSRDLNGGSYVDLHGVKNAVLLRYFNQAKISHYHFPHVKEPHIRVHNLPGFFKDRPSMEESASYLYGWLAGYFAADGTVSQAGQCTLSSVHRENLEFARDVAMRIGIRTFPIYDVGEREQTLPDGSTQTLHMWMLNLERASMAERFFLIDEHRRRWLKSGGRTRHMVPSPWKVVSVEQTDRVEEVYCAKVPKTEVFALEDDLLTGNSKYPLLGMELQSKDSKLVDFYSDHFLDEEHGLNYPKFLIDFGREYWTVGESVCFGSFNESLGIWDDEELLNPDDLEVVKSPFLKQDRYFIRLPQTLRTIIEKRSPVWEYEQLMTAYPELAHYSREDTLMPVSSILLQHHKFTADTFNPRGVPILMRAMRSLIQQEMLNSALDAVADRLYTPLILAKLGASATDLGTTVPWIPDENDLMDFEEALDSALAADFRVLVHHFAIQMESVLGRENVPDLTPDFERIEDRILQTFGLSRTMLTGACLTGDTQIHVSRAGKGFKMPLRDLVARFTKQDAHLPARRWRDDIETYVARADGEVVRLGLLAAAYESGIKQVFEVQTVQGRSIKASAQHPFLTEADGWVALRDLQVGDRIQVNTGHVDVTRVLWQVGSDEIISITPLGEEMTYDLTMVNEPHNFLADDFVVHNSAGQTYAADALNRDLISQLLTTYQTTAKNHYRRRALVVAEAQEHYDYEERNGKRYVKMEEILEIDEETGEETIVEQPKLLIPDMIMKSMSLKDEESQRQFYEQLRAAGIPISMKTRMVNIPINFDDEIEKARDEQVQLAVAEQETRRAMYLALKDKGLPIPQDLLADFQPIAGPPINQGDGMRVPLMGTDALVTTPNLAPTQGDFITPPDGGVTQPGMPAAAVDPYTPMPGVVAPMPNQGQSSRPEESDEMRKDMPKAGTLHRSASRMRTIAQDHYVAPEPLRKAEGAEEFVVRDPSNPKVVLPNTTEAAEPRGAWASPKHVGMRRYADVSSRTLWDTLVDDDSSEEE